MVFRLFYDFTLIRQTSNTPFTDLDHIQYFLIGVIYIHFYARCFIFLGSYLFNVNNYKLGQIVVFKYFNLFIFTFLLNFRINNSRSILLRLLIKLFNLHILIAFLGEHYLFFFELIWVFYLQLFSLDDFLYLIKAFWTKVLVT